MLRTSIYHLVAISFKNPYSFTVEKTGSNYAMSFKTDHNLHYEATFELLLKEAIPEFKEITTEIKQGNTWLFTFKLQNQQDYELTKTGDQFRVFSTIIKIIEQFLQQMHNAIVIFEAVEENRFRLYDHLLKRIISESPGYSYRTLDSYLTKQDRKQQISPSKVFILFRK